jgi:DNA polymerase III subunit epsilon
MMLLLGLDFETTGLSREQDLVIEVGLAMWDVDMRKIVRVSGFLVKYDTTLDERWDPQAEAVHGISQEEIAKFGVPETIAFKTLLAWYKTSDFIVAHNGLLFDKIFLENWAARLKMELPKRIWVDTRVDLPTPFNGKLRYHAADLGFLNPFPHRAVFDVATMLRVMDHYDIASILHKAKEPTVTVQAVVSFADKDLARARGYYWDPDLKQWRRLLKDSDVGREQREAGFQVRVVEVQKQ